MRDLHDAHLRRSAWLRKRPRERVTLLSLAVGASAFLIAQSAAGTYVAAAVAALAAAGAAVFFAAESRSSP